MKKLTCPVCGTEFIPQIADHYVAVTDNAGSGLSRLAGSAKPETYYDAFDCPQCGCQLRPELAKVMAINHINAKDVATMMGLLKVARIATGYKEDNFVDLAGYAACAGEIAAAERGGGDHE